MTAGGEGQDWVVRLGGAASPGLRVLCLPYSGAGPSVFRPLVPVLPPPVELFSVQLPGRERRQREAPVRELARVVEAIGLALPPGSAPWVFLGHSLGGLLAFELARWLRQEGRPLPRALVVSAARAPHLPYPHPTIHDATDEVAKERLRAMAGTPDAILEDPAWMALLLPPLRADMGMVETYRYQPAPPLPVPILALWGEEDQVIRRPEVEGWAQHTSQGFDAGSIPGGHFFLRTEGVQVLRALKRFLELEEPTPFFRSARPPARAGQPGRP